MSIILNVSTPYIPEGSGFTHTQTKYTIYEDREMTEIVTIYNTQDAAKKLLLELDIDISRYSVLYYIVELTLENSDSNIEDIVLKSDLDTIYYNKKNTIEVSTIYTPKIKINTSTLDVNKDNIKVTTSPFKLVYGTDVHVNTDWSVKNTSGEILWERTYDSEHRTEIIIPNNVFSGYDVYIIEAIHRSNADESFLGRLIVSNDISDNNIVLKSDETLSINTDNVLKIFSTMATKLIMTWSLLDSENNYIYKNVEQITHDIYTPFFLTIDGFLLEERSDYKLEIEMAGFKDRIFKRTFDLTVNPYSSMLDRYIIRTEYNFLKLIEEVPNFITRLPGVTKEYINGLVPIQGIKSVILYDLKRNYLLEDSISLNRDREYNFYKFDFKENVLLGTSYTEEVDGGTGDVIEKLYTSKITFSSYTYDAIVAYEEELLAINEFSSLMTPTLTEDGIKFIFNKDKDNFKHVNLVNDSVVYGSDILSLDQYYSGLLDTNYYGLNTVYRFKHSDYIVEKVGSYSKIDSVNAVTNVTYPHLNYNERSVLFESFNNLIINVKEIEGILRIIILNGDTLDIVNEIETVLNFNELTFVQTLSHELLILEPTQTGHNVHKLV